MSVADFLRKTFLYKMYRKRVSAKEAKEFEVRNRYFKEEANVMLKAFSEALNSAGVTFWLDFGTLLGYYREHDFIKHDCDLDFGVMLKDAARVKTALENHGFQRISYYKATDGGVEECYKFMHTSLDVFYFREEGDRLYCNTFTTFSKFSLRRMFSLKKIPCFVKKIYIPNLGITNVEFKGSIVGVPNNAKEQLEWHYGKSFMTPNPNFDYKKEAKNIIYHKLSEVSGYLMVFGRKV